MKPFPRKEPTIGLALGAGGAKGLSHIGVIKVLEEHHIPIDYIAGTSIGALVGGFFAATKNIRRVEEIALATNWRELLSLADFSLRHGLIAGEKLKKFIESEVGAISFGELKIPFAAVATDMRKGEIAILKNGEVALAMRASISLPLVFKPVFHEGKILVDGGLTMPVPVKVVRDMGAELVIAVNFGESYFSQKRESIGFYQMAQDITKILQLHLSKENVRGADIIISPSVAEVGWDKFLTREKTQEVISAGEEAMIKALPQLKLLIKQKSKAIFRRFFEWIR